MGNKRANLSVPAGWSQQDRRFGESVKQNLDVLQGQRGDKLDRAVTFRDLLDTGLVTLARGVTNFDGNASSVAVVSDVANLDIPSAPTGLSASGAFQNIILTWNLKLYEGHSHVEVWSHTADVIASATLAAQVGGFTGTYADPVGTGVTRYYWVRAVNSNGVTGPFNSSTGTEGQTSPDVDFLLTTLNSAVTESQLANTLTTKLDGFESDITSLETTFGSTSSAATSAAAAAASESAAIAAKASALGAKNDAVAAKTAALLAQTGAETAESNAETAKTSAETAKAGAETAQTAASTSATGAAGSASSATNSATAAANSATAAGNSASAAATSESNASTHATDSQTAATASQTAKLAAETAESNAETAETNSASSATSAAGSASNAATSATAAANSATAAGNSAAAAASSESSASTYATDAGTASTAAQSAKVSAETASTNAANSASAASTSASNASASETAAGTSATAADTAKTAAQTARSGAETAETNAASSETNASGSASSASTSATNAANSATAAGNSASAANTSAQTAASEATAAGTSATAASASQTAASTSETNAANSASAASTSATTAAASETAAGQSASTASTHASTASTKAGEASTFASNASTSATNAANSATSASSTVNGLTARLNDVNNTGSGGAVTVEQAYSATATNTSDITSLEGQYTVKIDANGAVAGFGLASTSTSLGTGESEFYVNADRFAIMRGGSDTTAATAPFVVQSTSTTHNGVSVPAGVYMADAFIKNGAIVNAKIANAAIDNAKIASLDAGKITSGKVDTSRLNIDGATLTSTVINGVATLVVNELSANKLTSGTIDASQISVTNLDADEITGDVNVFQAINQHTSVTLTNANTWYEVLDVTLQAPSASHLPIASLVLQATKSSSGGAEVEMKITMEPSGTTAAATLGTVASVSSQSSGSFSWPTYIANITGNVTSSVVAGNMIYATSNTASAVNVLDVSYTAPTGTATTGTTAIRHGGWGAFSVGSTLVRSAFSGSEVTVFEGGQDHNFSNGQISQAAAGSFISNVTTSVRVRAYAKKSGKTVVVTKVGGFIGGIR